MRTEYWKYATYFNKKTTLDDGTVETRMRVPNGQLDVPEEKFINGYYCIDEQKTADANVSVLEKDEKKMDEAVEPKFDLVKKARHYNLGRYETIDKIDDFLTGKPLTPEVAFAIGTMLRYVDRLGRKSGDQRREQTQEEKNYEDLKKSCYYMLFGIMRTRGLQPIEISKRIGNIFDIIEK